MKKGFPIVLSAPSGAGKTTLAHMLVDNNKNLFLSVSYTTRKCRGKEQNKIDYNFISNTLFNKMIDNNSFLEWAVVHKNKYGSNANLTEKILNKGNNVVFDIDVQGGLQIKKKNPNTLLIFILPPSINELAIRLIKRSTESKKHILKRIKSARKEIDIGLKKYDYIISNKKIDEALFDLSTIIHTKIIQEVNRNEIRKQLLYKTINHIK